MIILDLVIFLQMVQSKYEKKYIKLFFIIKNRKRYRHCGQLINLGDIECETKAKSNENATKTENEDEQSTVTPGSGICTASMIDVIQLREALPSRPKNGHKGTFGTALVIGGSL